MTDANREYFEEQVYKEYFVRSISKNLNDCTATSKAELLKRDGDSYARDEISAMWFGYKLAFGNVNIAH